MFAVLSIISLAQSSFVFPNENSELYIDQSYNIKWYNVTISDKIFLLHKDDNSVLQDSISSYQSGEFVLNSIVNDTTFLWKIPRELNKYDLEGHEFRLVLTDNNGLIGGSLSGNDNTNYHYSEYFKIKTNMNVTSLNKVIIPKKKYNILWDGFVYDTNVYLEEKRNGHWKETETLLKNTLQHNYIWQVPEDKTINNFRIKVLEVFTGIERYTENFNIYGIDTNIKNVYNVDLFDDTIEYDVYQYNDSYNYTSYIMHA